MRAHDPPHPSVGAGAVSCPNHTIPLAGCQACCYDLPALPERVRYPFKCPVCDGTKLVSRPPGMPGDVISWPASSTGPYSCGACSGTGIVWTP